MKQILCYIATILVLSSCTSPLNLISIDALEPATVSFPPEVTKVVLVNNSPTPPHEEEDKPNVQGTRTPILTLDSARNIFLSSLEQFMKEEKYFTEVELYPHKTNNTPILKDVNPLSRRKAQAICRERNADALVSLDLFAITVQLESENTAYFSNYSIIGAKSGLILRVFSKEGNQYTSRIGYVDSLFAEGPAPWDIKRNYAGEVNTLITDLSIVGADKVTGKLIPSWKKHDRWYYSGNSKEMKQAASFVKEGKWADAAVIWGQLFDKETKANKKIRLASNIALANECLDDIDNASNWINIAYEMLSVKDKAKLEKKLIPLMQLYGSNKGPLIDPPASNDAERTFLYKKILTTRKNNSAKLEEQLGITDEQTEDDVE